MADVICVRVCWNGTELPLRLSRFHKLHVSPEAEHPFGRKGLALASAWNTLAPAADGMLILDGDVAVDPYDVAVMMQAIDAQPLSVLVAPVKLWPASTHLKNWVWGHGINAYSQEDADEPNLFTFSFTYLPRLLIEDCIRVGMASWTYPNVDKRVCARAQANKCTVRIVECFPTHVNY
jgi:hypothetical protein